ncbi:FliM/FliN family flagellar motor switch protein [Vibrio diazotrophicus]|uniref:FliM/FliN family flagellar motor switch protein n=1 Tax=Vibrio diazotrophicus TaxID=685 RepID=UPI000C9DF87D|nr:flagellar motor switch protein FliM [Vibrio diazotrophicus]PNH95445.1 flagellar motor switch protein FliM [Vibrio diazotrophicus]
MSELIENLNTDVKPLNVELLGKPIHIVREKLAKIINDSTNGLITELQSWLSGPYIDINIKSVEIFELSNLSFNMKTVSQYNHESGGSLFINLDDKSLIRFSDRFYGTDIERKQTVITSSDKRLQDRIGKLISQWVAPKEMWRTSGEDVAFGTGIKVDLSVTSGEHNGELAVFFDNRLVQTLINQLDLQSNENLKPQFYESLKTTPVRLNVLLSKKTMTLSEVLSLSPQDILPIDLLSSPPVSIGNANLFTGRVAEQDGQLVLILNQDKDS